MSQAGIISVGAGGGVVNSVTGTNGVTASPTTGAVVVSGVNATTSTVGVASFNSAQFTVTSGAVSIIGGAPVRFSKFKRVILDTGVRSGTTPLL